MIENSLLAFKDEEIKRRAEMLHPMLIAIIIEMGDWSWRYDQQKIVLTSTVSTEEEDRKLGRVSPSHRECRAVDIRTRDWDQKKIRDFVNYFSEKYGDLGAISSSGRRSFIVDKSRTKSPHLHVQLDRAKFSKQNPLLKVGTL